MARGLPRHRPELRVAAKVAMSDPKKSKDGVDAMIEFATDGPITHEEAEKELREDGVDVTGFLARLEARLKPHRDAIRLAPLTAARDGVAADRARVAARSARSSRYEGMDKAALYAEIRRRQPSDQAHAHFNKLRELSDDDLRKWLEDHDELDDDE